MHCKRERTGEEDTGRGRGKEVQMKERKKCRERKSEEERERKTERIKLQNDGKINRYPYFVLFFFNRSKTYRILLTSIGLQAWLILRPPRVFITFSRHAGLKAPSPPDFFASLVRSFQLLLSFSSALISFHLLSLLFPQPSCFLSRYIYAPVYTYNLDLYVLKGSRLSPLSFPLTFSFILPFIQCVGQYIGSKRPSVRSRRK